MTPHERLAQRFGEWFGLDLSRGGRLENLERVVRRRTEQGGFGSPDAYVVALAGPQDPEVLHLLETVTVGHTWFFRDAEQTDAIAQALRESATKHAPVRAWVAGCSTGEDAYTVAILAGSLHLPVAVLGTDVNPRALERAREGRYAEWSTRQVPAAYEHRLVRSGGQVRVDPALSRTVRFERHNLADHPPRPSLAGATSSARSRTPDGGTGWDVILCRNVLIYFRREDAIRTVELLSRALRPGGWLFLGASEVIHEPPPGCRVTSVGARVAIRRRTDPPAKGHLSPAPPTVTVRPESGEGAIERALAKLEAGRTEEAILLCARVLEEDPLSAEAHLVSGMAFHLARDPEAAIRALDAAVLLDPELWPAYFYLGQALEKLGRSEDAREAYRQADERARTSRSRKLGVLDAYKVEIAALARGLCARPIPEQR